MSHGFATRRPTNMGACKAPIFHLLTSSPLSPSRPNLKHSKPIWAISKPPLTSRRLFVLSIPVGTLLLTNSIQSNSCYASESFDPVSTAEREASVSTSQRISEALELLDKGKELQAQGDFNQALYCFTQVIEKYKDFAFSDYARVGRALALYEVGDKEEAIVELEDVSISLKGYPEVHAALAAALYEDKHAPLLAENQFTIAVLLDPHYSDLSYVKETKHWPPSLISSLRNFITLS